jgi:hypothetical protein
LANANTGSRAEAWENTITAASADTVTNKTATTS